MTWPIILLDSVSARGSGHTPSQKHPEYWDGGVKWVSLTDSSALDKGYIHDTAKKISSLGLRHSSAVLYPKGTVIVSRDAGVGKSAILGDEMAVSQHFIAWRCDSKRLHGEYLYQWLQSHKLEFERIAVGSTVKTIGLAYFKKLRLPLPPIEIQKKIAKTLDTWDISIEKTEQLIAAKEYQHAGLLQLLVSSGRARHHWETVEFDGIVTERLEKTKTHDQHPVLTSSRRGMFLQSEYFSKQVTSEDNTGYKVMRRGDFTFRSMTDDGRFVFNRLTTLEAGVISPAYGVFYATDCCPEFLAHFLNSSYFGNALNRESQGGTRKALRFSSIAQMEIDFPPRHEQERIARILDASRGEIEIEKIRLTMLKKQKRGLMQKLLTGQRQVKVKEQAVA